MKFSQRILIESAIKYFITFLILGLFWRTINSGLMRALESGKLEAIAVVMGIVGLSSISGYFAFSYTAVGKNRKQRLFGYTTTFFLGLALATSLLIIYIIAVLWVPEMKVIWALILLSLYIGTVLFDNLDLLRMGLDVAATSFFEQEIVGKSEEEIRTAIEFLKEGQRLHFANTLIGKGIIQLGNNKKDKDLVKAGKWILGGSYKTQQDVDKKVAEAFEPYAKENPKIEKILNNLKDGESQEIADNSIANLLYILK